MDADTVDNIRKEQVESFGRLMAGFSHDMKNHLGIIRESNGLMSDLIEMGGFGENDVLAQRLTKAIASIEKRVIIAADMLHHLSRFAHRSDTPLSTFQVNDLITEEYTFLERFSRLQQINVTLELGQELSTIYNDPSLFQHIFYRVHSICLAQLSAGHNLAIITRQKQKSVEIVFRLVCREEGLIQLFDKNLHAAINKLSGTLEILTPSQDDVDIILTVPPVDVE